MSRPVFHTPRMQQAAAVSFSADAAATAACQTSASASSSSFGAAAASPYSAFGPPGSPPAGLPPQSFPAFYTSSQSLGGCSASLLPSPPPLLPKLSSSSSASSPPSILYAQHSAAPSCSPFAPSASSGYYLAPSSLYPPLRLSSSPDYLSALQSFPLHLTPPPAPLPGSMASALPSSQRFPAGFPSAPAPQPSYTYAAVDNAQQAVYGAALAPWDAGRERRRDCRPTSRCLHQAEALHFRGRARVECSCSSLLYGDCSSTSALFRTELCASQYVSGACAGGSCCPRAHSLEELRPVYYDSKYKTELCKRFHVLGPDGCRFGTRCKFLHDEVRVKAGEGEYWLCSEREQIVRVEVIPLHHFHRRQLLDQLTFCPPAGPVSPLSASPRPQHRRFAATASRAPSPAASPSAQPAAFSSFPPYSFQPALHASPALSTRSLPLQFNEQLAAAAAGQSGSSSMPLRTRRLGQGVGVIGGGAGAAANGSAEARLASPLLAARSLAV